MNEKFLDPVWRLNNLYKIVTKEGELATFKQNPVQAVINKSKAKRKMVLKARQFGVSTNELLKLYDKTIFTRNVTNGILAHENDGIKKLFRIVKRAYDFSEPEIKPQIDRGGGSKYEMYFPAINSRIYCDLESRGDTIHNLHISEVAFMKDKSRLKATLQAVPLGGCVTLESTPNGMEEFYEMWVDKDQPYEKLFFPWFIFPEYQINPQGQRVELTYEEKEFKKKAKKLYGVNITKGQLLFRRFKQKELGSLFIQEYPEDDVSCFLSSGASFFNLKTVKDRLDNCKQPLTDKGYIKIYEPYNKEHHYVCGADTAEGVGSDFSVGVIINITTKEQVAEIRGHFKPYDFAHELNNLCMEYQKGDRYPPLLAVERNNHGHAVLLELDKHIKYRNLYKTKDGKIGWVTDKITRPIMLNAFREAVENNSIIFNSEDLLKECLTLVVNNGKPEAMDGKHDDCVIAGSIAAQMLIEESTIPLQNIANKIYL